MVQPLWKTVQQFLIKLNLQLPYTPVNSTSEYLNKKNEIYVFSAQK